MALESDDWDREEEKYKCWKTNKKGNWKEYIQDNIAKKPMWIVWAPCGNQAGPVEVARGWGGPEEMFKAMQMCGDGLLYKANADQSVNEADATDENFQKILSTTLEHYKKPGKHKAKNGAGWPALSVIKYKMPGKNQVKVLCMRIIDDTKSAAKGNPYKKKGTKMEMTGFTKSFKNWEGLNDIRECVPTDLNVELLDTMYDKHDRQ